MFQNFSIQNLSIGKKIGFGFSMALVLTLFVGGAGYYALISSAKATAFFQEINTTEDTFAKAKDALSVYLLNNYSQGREFQEKAYSRAINNLSECKNLINEKKTSNTTPFVQKNLTESAGYIEQYMLTFEKLNNTEAQKIQLASDLIKMEKQLMELMLEGGTNIFLGDTMIAISKTMFAESSGYVQRSTEDAYQRLYKTILKQNEEVGNWFEKIRNSKQLNQTGQSISKLSTRYMASMSAYHDEEILGKKHLEKMNALQSSLHDNLTLLGAFTLERMEKVKKIAKISIVGFLVASLFVGITVLFFIVKSVVNPIVEVADGLKDIAQGEGNLTMRLDIKSRDEVGVLADRFNQFMEKLQGIIKDIAGNAETLETSSKEMASLSHGMSQASGEMAQGLNTVAAASEEMSNSMNFVAEISESASRNIEIVSSSTGEMSSTINEIAKNANSARNISSKAVTVSRDASSRIDDLNNIATEIGKVTEVITEISEQTNLLALNATIEAARAGSAGKGFAVVANEIKGLASHTATATLQIKEQIQKVQGSTDQTSKNISEIVTVIGEVDTIVSSIAAAVEEQSSITLEMAENISRAANGISEVNKNVLESTEVSSSIAKDIDGVNSQGGSIADSSLQANKNADQLSLLAEKMKALVNLFIF